MTVLEETCKTKYENVSREEVMVTEASHELKNKMYRVKNADWCCGTCDIYCNSQSQYDVHVISQKHKFVVRKLEEDKLTADQHQTDENNNFIPDQNYKTLPNSRMRTNFSLAEIAENPLAIKFNINAVKYLITDDKKKGKFEKFGFYCKTCDAYMTGQIQLIMHVRGSKHQFYHPNEIPDYKPSKVFNPIQQKRKLSGGKPQTSIENAFNTNHTKIDITHNSSIQPRQHNKNKYYNINQMNNMFVSASPGYYQKRYNSQEAAAADMSQFAAYQPNQVTFNNLTQQQQFFTNQMNLLSQRLSKNVNIGSSNGESSPKFFHSGVPKMSPDSQESMYPQQYMQYGQTVPSISYPNTPQPQRFVHGHGQTPTFIMSNTKSKPNDDYMFHSIAFNSGSPENLYYQTQPPPPHHHHHHHHLHPNSHHFSN